MTELHAHIVGARPNFMKAAPVVSALQSLGHRPTLVHTGQHYDRDMSAVFFGELGLPEPDINLEVGSGSHAGQTASLMIALERALMDLSPSRVVVYGDINSTLAAAVVGAKLQIPVGHVEAGLRSFDRSMPEEINRVVTDALADLHFVTSPEAMAHLAREGLPTSGMYFVGNPMIDTLLRLRDYLDVSGARARFELPQRYAVVTLHRPANVDVPDVAVGLVKAMSEVSKALPIVLPLHPRGRSVLNELGLSEVDGIKIVDPLGYLDFMALVAGSALVLTDSGGIQEETTILGVPCLTLRDNTERPITVTMGTNRLVGSDPAHIVAEVERVLGDPPRGMSPPLWDGHAGRRIADVLVEKM